MSLFVKPSPTNSCPKCPPQLAHFEYDNGNSKIPTTCINRLKQKYEGRLNHESMSIEEVQRLLVEQDIPTQIAKELAVTILRDRFSVA